jgi:hypothetical protein
LQKFFKVSKSPEYLTIRRKTLRFRASGPEQSVKLPSASKTGHSTLRTKLRYGSLVFPEKNQAINYAKSRACFRSGEIRILDSTGAAQRTIHFSEADRKR